MSKPVSNFNEAVEEIIRLNNIIKRYQDYIQDMVDIGLVVFPNANVERYWKNAQNDILKGDDES